MLGYTEKDVYKMMAAINIAYEIIDGPEEVEEGLHEAYNFLDGILAEGHVM